MKRSRLNPGKRCKSCTDGTCGSCVKGFIVKRPKQASRMPAKAPKRAKLDKAYTAQRKAFLLRFPRCLTLNPAGPCNAPATDVHHRLGRGSFHLDETAWWACCSHCHLIRIHANPAWAHQMGYLLNRASGIVHPVSTIFLPYDTHPRNAD